MFNLTPYRKHNEISYYDPFQMMEEMERRFWGGNPLASFKTDIRDKGDSYLLEAELPGFQKEDIDIQLSDNNLTISAEHKTESEERIRRATLSAASAHGAATAGASTSPTSTRPGSRPHIKTGF